LFGKQSELRFHVRLTWELLVEGRVDVLEKEGNEGRKGGRKEGRKERRKELEKEEKKEKEKEEEKEEEEEGCTSYLVKTASKVGPPMN